MAIKLSRQLALALLGVARVAAAEPPAEAPVEVTVAGTRLQSTAGSAHVIDSKKLERFEYDDPHAILVSVPGVYFRGEDGFGLRPNLGIRGVNPDRSKKVALMEDGIPFAPAPYSAPAAYYFPVITRMQAVRVIKGPAALAYGPQTIGGAVDLVTRSIPSSPSGQLDGALGEYGYNKLHGFYGSSDEKSGFLIEGVHIGNDGFKQLPNGADTGFYRNEWMFKGVHVFDPSAPLPHELRVKLTYSDELSNESYLGLSDRDFEQNPLARYGVSSLDRMRWFRTSFVVTHVIDPLPDLTITTNLYRHDLSRTWRKVNAFRGASLFEVLTEPESPANAVYYSVLTGQSDSSSPGETLMIGPNQRDFVAQGIETRVLWQPRTGPVSHRLEYGVRLHQDRVERRHTEDGFLIQSGQLVPEGSPTVTTAFNEAISEALSLHVMDAVALGRLTLTPGVRVELVRSELRDRLTSTTSGRLVEAALPGIGAHYALTDQLGVLAGVHRGFSPPAPGAGEQTKPELSVNYEAGARFTERSARAELIGFYNDYSNLTDVCTLSSGCLDSDLDRQFDAGKARIFGFEAYAEHRIPLGPVQFPLNVAYTFTRAEFLGDFESEDPIFGNVEDGDELPYVPRHQASASVGAETRSVGGAVSATYVSAMREQAGSEPLSEVLATDEQLVFDASVKYRVLPPLIVYANARNLLDSHYIVSRRPFGARPNAPRWIQVGAKVAF
jgi:Fe(3+) dicitrate transport protein